VKITPYAIAHMAETAREFQEVVDSDIWQHLHDVLKNSDLLLYRTYEFTKQHMESALVCETFLGVLRISAEICLAR